ncbi:MAG: glycosyltransferase family 39 protein [Anaerolineales bacterium]|jgi:4-amino-4-deoxy-L-arabinose transferase-like glycosyltransferase
MFIDKTKAFLTRVRESLPGRWFWLLVGLGLIVNGVYWMHQRGDINDAGQTLMRWSDDYHLEIVNILYLAVATPYLIGGGLLSAFAFVPIWKKQEEIQASSRTKEPLNWAYYLPRIGFTVLLFALLIFFLVQHKYSPILAWLWVYILVLQTLLLRRREKEIGINLSPNIARIDLIWMAGLFVAGLIIGSFALKDIPNIMIPDEGAFWETARAIANGDLKPDFFAFGVYTFPVASSLFQGWVMRFVGVNLWGWRFASVLAGTFTVIPLYLLAREWFDRRVAVIAALLMLTSPYYLSFARLGYNNSQALFPVVLCLYFWSLGYKRVSNLYYWLAGISAGLGFYTYPASWLGLVTVIIVMAVFTIIRRIQVRQASIAIAIFVAAITVTALPRIVYGASSDNPEPLFYKMVETSFVSNFYGSAYYSPEELHPNGDGQLLGSNEIFYAPDIYRKLLTRSTVRTLTALFDPFLVTEHFMVTNFAGGFLAAIGLALGLSFSLCTIKQTRSILLLTWLLAGLFFLSIIAAFPPRHTHLVTIIPVLALLSAVGFIASLDTLSNELQNKWESNLIPWGQMGVILLLSGALVVGGLKQYFILMPERNPPLFEDIVSWIAWRNDEPLTIVYIGADTEKPHRVQYHVDTFMVPHKYVSTTPADFRWRDVPFGSVVFYEQQEERIPPPPLEFGTSATYTLQDETIGKAWTNTDVDLQPALLFSYKSGRPSISNFLLYAVLAIIVFVLSTTQIRVTTEKEADEPILRIHAEIKLRKFIRKITERKIKQS